MRILFIADIMGKPGRWALSQLLRPIKVKHQIDFVVANVENAAGGYGLTKPISQKIMSYGVDVQTSGNHIWDRNEIFPFLDFAANRVIRPANCPSGSPGYGSYLHTLANGRKVGVINAEGRVFGRNIDCPFRTIDGELRMMKDSTKIIVIDFHAETTSEKGAMAHYVDGRVSLLVGTHTHIQTADEHIMPNGTAFITDAGMTGPHSGVIGMNADGVLGRFLTALPHRFTVSSDDVKIQGVIAEIDDETGKAISIERLSLDFDGRVPEGYEIVRSEADEDQNEDEYEDFDGSDT
ncbi:MAG: TIGR00282 family metallophosphoesterase [Candidatus Zixiibacteriota bacterium]